ncbi:sigma-70 family RNA polymerase sigma factor [Candidatus Uhrbacteria bacterium]|nr:sigma-70 family RNA polymerase sigma factor [Candidatus Uhrbacteria bacterium]
MTELMDRYLLYRVQVKQDPEAFAKIYDRYVTAIYRFVILKLPRRQDAEDITAETFTKFWQHLQSQKKVKSVRAYLYQIARNLIADFYRNRKTDESLELVTFEADVTSNTVQEETYGRSYMEARTELSLVLNQLDKLKDSYRDVLALRLIDGLSFADIAAILGKSTGNVRVIYYRGMKALKEQK